MKKVLLVVALLFLASEAKAQTTTSTLTWNHLSILAATVNTYTFTSKVDAGSITPITPTCVQAGVDTFCSSPIILTSGNHTITIVATLGGNSASGSVNYIPGAVPSAPANIKVTITVTIP